MNISAINSDLTTRLLGFAIFVLTAGSLLFAEAYLQEFSIAGIYFHGIPSESMMQTVSIFDLKNEAFISLWNLHIQPPLFDALRMVLAKISSSNDPLYLQFEVDKGLYLIWAMIYGLICMTIFFWLSKISSNWFALLSALLFAASPAMLLYATLLEATLLSSFLILCFIYLLWKIRNQERVSPWLLAISFLLLFLTRSIFQWQWLILIFISLVLLKYPIANLRKFLLISGIVVALFLLKQFLLFGVTSTSTFTGLNLCQSIGVCKSHYVPDLTMDATIGLPNVLIRDKKLTEAHNFNHLKDLSLHNAYLQDYRDGLSAKSPRELATIYLNNLSLYFQPSSNYASTNILLVKLPERWRVYYEKVFSVPLMPLILLACLIFWGVRSRLNTLRSSVGIAIPVMAIFVISVLFESGENMRFKFFIEPILFIFISSQIYSAGLLIWDLLVRGRGDVKKAA
jgi:hypothetical protein